MKKITLVALSLLSLLSLFATPAHAGLFGFGSEESQSGDPEDTVIFGQPAALAQDPRCASEYYRGTAPIIANSKLAAGVRAGCFDNFALLYSPLTKAPIVSAEHLTRDSVIAAAKMPRKDSFHAERHLPSGERAELDDFKRSGYDRGHMSPNKDMPTVRAQWQCFSLANMVAQDPNNNRGLWEGVESAVRTLAKKNGDLYLITGPLFIGNTVKSLHGVLVPTNIFKAVLDPRTGQAAAYMVKNEPGMDYQVISIAELDRLSGLNLFPTLSASARENAMPLPAPTPHH